MKERVGMPPKELSPAPSTTSGHPPCVIFHGTADDTTTFATAEKFTELMKRAGNDCPLHSFEGKGHVFYRGRGQNGDQDYHQALASADEFLKG